MSAPTYILKMKDANGTWWRVGAMWFNQESLTLSIIIDPFAQIPPGAHITAYNQQSVPKAEQKPKVETPR